MDVCLRFSVLCFPVCKKRGRLRKKEQRTYLEVFIPRYSLSDKIFSYEYMMYIQKMKILSLSK
jgi:hypothetical protein